MKHRWGSRCSQVGGDFGFALIEVVVALALVGTAGISFLSALSTASRSTMSVDDTIMANSLAGSQMEYLLSQPYDDSGESPGYELIAGIPEGWAVVITAERLDPELDGSADDDGLQLLTVEIYHGGTLEIQVTTRKVNPDYVP